MYASQDQISRLINSIKGKLLQLTGTDQTTGYLKKKLVPLHV